MAQQSAKWLIAVYDHGFAYGYAARLEGADAAPTEPPPPLQSNLSRKGRSHWLKGATAGFVSEKPPQQKGLT